MHAMLGFEQFCLNYAYVKFTTHNMINAIIALI